MKLSEAIRLGAMMVPQEFGPMRETGACALQTALLAVGALPEGTFSCYRASRKIWPWLERIVSCPICGEGINLGMTTIAHLNDNHLWTREAIADWVATVEPQDIQEEQAKEGEELRASK